MAQGKTSPDFRCDRSITRMKAQRQHPLWPLSFDQESGDTGVGLLPDKFSNHCITHGTIKKASQRGGLNKNRMKRDGAKINIPAVQADLGWRAALRSREGALPGPKERRTHLRCANRFSRTCPRVLTRLTNPSVVIYYSWFCFRAG